MEGIIMTNSKIIKLALIGSILLFGTVHMSVAAPCDVDGDMLEGIAEAVHALQVTAGMTSAVPVCSESINDNIFFELERPIENLENDWTFHYSGTTAIFNQSGISCLATNVGNPDNYDFAHSGKDAPGAYGVIGTIRLHAINRAWTGFGMYVGTLGEYHVHVTLYFNEWNDQLNVQYRVRLADSQRNLIKTVAWGGYVPGVALIESDYRLGFAKIGSGVSFYLNGEQLLRWETEGTIGPRGLTDIWYWEETNSSIDSNVSATFKDISIIE